MFFLLLLSSLLCAETLSEFFELAKARSSDVRAAESRIFQNESKEKIGKGAILPKMRAIGGYGKQDVSGLKPGTEDSDTSLKLNLSQTLFDGGEAFAVLASIKSESEAAHLKKIDREINLFNTIATLYFGAGSILQDINNLENSIEKSKERLNELEKRKAIGRSRESEVITARSLLSSLKSQLEGDRGELLSLYETIEEFTGVNPKGRLTFKMNPIQIKPLSEYLELVKNRPDLLALDRSIEAAEESVVSKRRSHFGDLALGGNYHLIREGTLKESDWDVALTYTLPLYEGGTVDESVKLALEEKREKTILKNSIVNGANYEVRRAHVELTSMIEEIKLLEEAYAQSLKNYELLQKEYRFSLVTNLDVVSAMTSMIDAKRNLDKTLYSAKMLKVKLETKAGIINSAEN